jgi:hypothetical protein
MRIVSTFFLNGHQARAAAMRASSGVRNRPIAMAENMLTSAANTT